MIQRIAVMGAGSLGTILGAYLSKAGRDVVLIDAYQAHVDALNQNGAHITGAVEMTVPVKAITPEQMEGQYDLFFYLAKQTYNDVAIPQMMAHMGEGSVICTGQNGLPERAVSKAVGVHRTLGSPVGWGATFMGPGCSALTSASQAFYLGTLDGQITEKLLEVKSILEDMCPVHVSENLMGYRWTKLLVNCTFSGLSASFGCTFGDVLDDPRAVRLAVKLGAECIAVAKGCGVRMEPHSLAGDLELVASMAQDLAHGRKCEIDAINGVASESGVDAHVPTPINDMVVHVVKGIQDGKWKGSFDNLKFFEGLY